MSASIAKAPTIVDIGTPPPSSNVEYKWVRSMAYESVEVHFHKFEGLLPSGDERISPTGALRRAGTTSPQFTCLGHQWSLTLYPGGVEESSDGYAALGLDHWSSSPIQVEVIISQIGFHKGCNSTLTFFQMCAPGWEEGPHRRRVMEAHRIGRLQGGGEDTDNAWDVSELAERSALLNSLVGGHILDRDMSARQPFVPENPLCKNILKRFNEEGTADTVFEVGGESVQGRGSRSRKKSKAAPVTFYAHRSILQDSATTLSELAKSAQPTSSTIQINDVKPEIFHHLLYYVYGGTVPEEEMKDNAKDLIDAADKYGVVHLKLEAEACYAKSVELTADNALDNLLYADSKNCALLKEVVVDFIAENGKDLLAKVSFDDVPGSVAKDLLTVMAREEEETGAADEDSVTMSDDDGYDTMRVSTLRRKLHKKGLDIDGSREAMIALLKEHS